MEITTPAAWNYQPLLHGSLNHGYMELSTPAEWNNQLLLHGTINPAAWNYQPLLNETINLLIRTSENFSCDCYR